MGYKSGGLSYFEDGGSADQEEQTTTSVQAKPIAAKGKFGMPALAGNVPVNESVLEQMGRLYMQRQEQRGGMRGFLNAIKDAAAWGDGSQAVAARDKLRQEQEAEDMQFGSQIAQYRAALASQKAFEDRRNKELGLGSGQLQQASGEEGQAPAGQVAGTLDVPPELRVPLLNARTEAEYNEIVKNWALEKAKETSLQKNAQFLRSMGVPEETISAIAVTNVAGPSAFTKQDVYTRDPKTGAVGTVQIDPLQQARKMVSTPPGVGRPAPPSAAAPKSLPQAQPPQGAPAPGGQPPAAGGAPAPRPAAPGAPAAPVAPVAPAPGPATSRGASEFGFIPGSKEDIAAQTEKAKAVIGGLESEKRKVGEDVAASEVDTKSSGKKANGRMADIDRLNQLVSDPKTKEAFGIFAGPGFWSALGGVVTEAINAGNFGVVGIKGLPDAIRKLGGTKEQIDAAQTAARIFAEFRLQNAAANLKRIWLSFRC